MDTTGTEVSLTYDINVSLENCPQNLKFYVDEGHTTELYKTGNVLKIYKYLPVSEANAIHTETVYWNWPYQTSVTDSGKKANDLQDTMDSGKEVTMSISVTGMQVIEKPVVENKLSGKTAVFVGDSITYGIGTTDGARYWEVLGESLELSNVTGMGVAGSCISTKSNYGNSNSPLINRYDSIPEADLITIFMGTNDYGHETPLGTINDKRDTSFYGALNVILPSLIKKYPNSRIVVVTPLHRYGFGTSGNLGTAFTYDYLENGGGANLEDYVNALKAVCNKYSIPVIDLYTLSGLDPSDSETKANYMPDGLHPNAKGHEIIANIMEDWLKMYADTFPKYIGDDSPENIKVEEGNKYDSSHSSDLNRASISKNVYLKSGTVIKLKDTTTYKYGVYQTSNEYSTQSTLISGGWITKDYAIESDGWYGIAFARNDNANFDFDNVDPAEFDNYLDF